AVRTSCVGTPPDGQVCIPGGAFWMGGGLLQGGGETDAIERIVVLSPFFLSAHEVTVSELRAGKLDMTQIASWSGSLSGDESSDWCTITTSPGPHESLPANCITWQGARDYCLAMGGDLPTEAQLEYVMSGLVS